MLKESGDRFGLPVSEWLSISTGLIWATQREIESDFLDADHAATNQVIGWLVKKGKVAVRVGGRITNAKKGDWIFPGFRKGRQKIEPGTVLLSLRFFAEWPAGRALFDHREILVFSSSSDASLTQAAEILESQIRRVARQDGFFLLNQSKVDLESYFSIRQAFEVWMGSYVRTMLRLGHRPSIATFMDQRVLRAAQFMDNRPLRLPLEETEVAQAVQVSVTHLNRLFRRDLGLSPKKYWDRRRLQQAVLLLQHRHRSVKEIAYELGFHSLSHFSAWFVRRQGVGPRAFQNNR